MNDKEDPVTKDHTKITGMIAILVVGFLIIISVYGVWTDPKPLEHPDPWYVYIVRFQTLIGGLLAVGAALITIRQMRKSDERADKRHEDLMLIQLRDVLEGKKALFQTFGARLWHLQQCFYGSYKVTEGWVTELPQVDIAQQRRTSIVDWTEMLEEILNDPLWKKNEKQLSGESRSAIASLRESCTDTYLLDDMEYQPRSSQNPGKIFKELTEESRTTTLIQLPMMTNHIYKKIIVVLGDINDLNGGAKLSPVLP